ncbi:hypothetical protein FRC06_004623 [Ceratobasidium sp. 370]|nr:hypothetical protein FRC06_004623 [Ceratobasidium sp. 370]
MASSSAKPLDAEDDIDPETIQSAVDMSLSLALSMVQSWMPAASSSASVNPSIAESRKKLEEYMRRPPRLGVGAPIPSAAQKQTQATHHETQRLKNRLVGSGAARRRAEDAKLNGLNKPDGDGSNSDQDESESRASAVKKNEKLVNVKSNGLSVFGSTATPKATPKPAAAPSTPARSSSSTSPGREATPGKSSSPSQLNNSPGEPMGIHTLPPKLSLAAKIWPRLSSAPSPSSTGPDRPAKRRKVAPMLPPLAPDLAWNMQLPASRSSSVSASVSSQAQSAIGPDTGGTPAEEPDRAQVGPGPIAVAQLSRKERKRLRREAAQQSASLEKQLVSAREDGSGGSPSGAEAPFSPSGKGRDAQPLSTPKAETDGSGDSDEGSETGSRIREDGEREQRKVHEGRLIYSDTTRSERESVRSK